MQRRMDLPEPRKNAVVISESMINHIAEVKNGIQWLGIEFPDTTVKFFQRQPVISLAALLAITILAIGEDSDPDRFLNLTLAGEV
jgi:hypothetical protein